MRNKLNSLVCLVVAYTTRALNSGFQRTNKLIAKINGARQKSKANLIQMYQDWLDEEQSELKKAAEALLLAEACIITDRASMEQEGLFERKPESVARLCHLQEQILDGHRRSVEMIVTEIARTQAKLDKYI